MLDPLNEHFGYLSDQVKISRYRTAIENVVKAGHVVMDLGCGSGLLGLMALRAGASKVLFVEEGPILEVARRTVVEAGFGDRSEFILANSYELELTERVDVILCDHVGYFGFDYDILGLLDDARQRFLKDTGIVVPTGVELMLAPIETATGRDLVGRWRGGSIPGDFAWVGSSVANAKHAIDLTAENLLAELAPLATLEFGGPAPAFLTWQADFVCMRDGTLDGLLGCFDCCLSGNVYMSNSPTAEEKLNRSQAFLPLEAPTTVSKGDKISATVMARPTDHILAWTVETNGGRFSQTTFNGLLLDDEALKRIRPDRIAQLNNRGRAHQLVLSYIDGKRTVAEIETLVRKEHPTLFPSQQATEGFVRKILAWDTGE